MNTMTKVLLQLFNKTTWDGDLISKVHRDALVEHGLANKCVGGWNVITSKGVRYLHELGYIQS